MNLWLLLTAAFIVQEPISSSVVLLEAYQNHYSVWLITLLFAAITIIEIIVGYYLGAWIEKRFGKNRLVASMKKRFETLTAAIGEYGKIVGLIVFVPLVFPVDAIFLPWFDISLLESIIYVFIGEFIFWYCYEWLLVFGVHSFITNSYWALVAIFAISVLVSVGVKMLMKKSKKKA